MQVKSNNEASLATIVEKK